MRCCVYFLHLRMPGKLSSFLKTRWVLWLVLLVFICFKIPHLHYPFYCDEGWVYAPAVKTMALTGPSLLPGSLTDYYSRGHPLLFHFLAALWIKCFGSSNIAVHSFPLFISIVFLIALFECSLRLFNRSVAILALLIVSTQVIFFAQASFVLPEVMLALFAFLSLYCYVTDRFVLTAVMLFGLFFTKESGLVYGAVIGIDAFVSLFRKGDFRKRWFRMASVLLPAVLIGSFFVIQKVRLGWYLLPEHTGLIHIDWNTFYAMFRQGLYWSFQGHSARHISCSFSYPRLHYTRGEAKGNSLSVFSSSSSDYLYSYRQLYHGAHGGCGLDGAVCVILFACCLLPPRAR